jgi:hypothetical protein
MSGPCLQYLVVFITLFVLSFRYLPDRLFKPVSLSHGDLQLKMEGHRYEGVLISPKPDQKVNKLLRPNSGFIQHTPHETQYTSSPVALTFASHSKKKSERCPSNHVSASTMTSASEEKLRPFNCFFQSREHVVVRRD